ncbi:MAG: transglutaminase domain-containing protein [Cytophagales bacterium]
MRLLFLSFLFLFITTNISAQHSRVWGQINKEDWDLEVFEEDPDAEALVLYDVAHSKFIDITEEKGSFTVYGYNIEFTRKKRIKILKQSGIERANLSIGVYEAKGEGEKFRYLTAHVYNRDEKGSIQKTELNQESIYKEKINDNFSRYKAACPDVKVGSIVEYTYTLESPYKFNLYDWEFQTDIPTLYSQYRIDMIPFYEYNFIAQGLDKFDYHTSYQADTKRSSKYYGVDFYDVINVYGMSNIPAFKEESFITTKDDYLMKMDFQLSKYQASKTTKKEVMSTWPKLCNDLIQSERYGVYLKDSRSIAKKVLAKEISNLSQDKKEKARQIIEYVKKNYTWNGNYSYSATQKAKNFYKIRKGSSADINLFTVSLLREAGLKSRPVILSTRGHGKIKFNYPYMSFFNHVIVFVMEEEFKYLADASEKLISYNRIPVNCMNSRGLVVSANSDDWVDLEINANSQNKIVLNLTINPDSLKCSGNVTIQALEYAAFYKRDNYKDDTDELKDYLKKNGFESDKVKSINFEKLEMPYIIAAQGNSEIESIEGDLIIKPFLDFPYLENPLKLKTRDYPIDFALTREDQMESTIIIPDNYKPYELPESISIDNNLVKINLDYKQEGTQLVINGLYAIKKSIYEPNEYSTIKEYFQTIVDQFNKEIVLVKR